MKRKAQDTGRSRNFMQGDLENASDETAGSQTPKVTDRPS